jgi:hypothetical protein
VNANIPRVISRFDHEVQIDHVHEAITKFVNGEIDYIVGTSAAEVPFFQLQRTDNDATRYFTVVYRGVGHSGPEGTVVYDDVRKTLLDFIDTIEAAHGFRSHEDHTRRFIYLGGLAEAKTTV